MSLRNSLGFIVPALACAVSVFADEVRMEDGSVFKGKILGIEKDMLSFEPKSKVGVAVFKIPLGEVAYLSTDEPIYLSDGKGEPVYVRVRGEPNNLLRVPLRDDSPVVSPAASLGSVADAWLKPDDAPAIKAAKKNARKWTAELYTEFTGKSGNVNTLGLASGVTLRNTGPKDRLRLSAKGSYARTDGDVSTDDFRGGVDYTWSPSFLGAYARSENGYDHIKEIDFYSTNAVGVNGKILEDERGVIGMRFGVAYRYEVFADGSSSRGPGLDVGFNCEYKWDWGRFVETFTYTPIFDDLNNYLITNEAFFEFKVMNGDSLKIRFGLQNRYESSPTDDRRSLDSTLFARIVYLMQ